MDISEITKHFPPLDPTTQAVCETAMESLGLALHNSPVSRGSIRGLVLALLLAAQDDKAGMRKYIMAELAAAHEVIGWMPDK